MKYESRLKEAMDRAINRQEEVGAALVLMKDGVQVMHYATGMANLERKIPMREDSICHAFSCTKIATSIAVMKLMEQGLIDIDWNLDSVLPEFAQPYLLKDGKKTPTIHKIKIRDLLNMTSGIPYPGDDTEEMKATNACWKDETERILRENGSTTRDFIRQISECPLLFEPGEQWMYGASADVLGAVIEVITGKKLSEYLSEILFKPLGMSDTAFYLPKEKMDRAAIIYDHVWAGKKPDAYSDPFLCITTPQEAPQFESGGAGLFSTALDYAKLGMMLADKGHWGETEILGRKTVEFMAANGINDRQRRTFNWDSVKGCGYANLVRVIQDKNAAGLEANIGTFGWDGWAGTYQFCDPTERLSITLFVQRCGAGTSQLARNITNIVYGML